MSQYVVIEYYEPGASVRSVTEFDKYEDATAYLQWSWEKECKKTKASKDGTFLPQFSHCYPEYGVVTEQYGDIKCRTIYTLKETEQPAASFASCDTEKYNEIKCANCDAIIDDLNDCRIDYRWYEHSKNKLPYLDLSKFYGYSSPYICPHCGKYIEKIWYQYDT